MSTSWRGRKEPTAGELLLVNWVLVLLRGIPVAIVVFGGLILHTVLRIFEYPFSGLSAAAHTICYAGRMQDIVISSGYFNNC